MTRVLAIPRGWCGRLAVLSIVAAAGCSLAAAGCGKPTATVSGKVTYKGAPLSAGAVTFHGDGGFVQSAWIDANGGYTIRGAPPGAVKVAVESAQPRAAPAKAGKTAQKHPGDKGGAAPPGKSVPIPAKYKDPAQSGLSYTLTTGEQNVDIPLD